MPYHHCTSPNSQGDLLDNMNTIKTGLPEAALQVALYCISLNQFPLLSSGILQIYKALELYKKKETVLDANFGYCYKHTNMPTRMDASESYATFLEVK